MNKGKIMIVDDSEMILEIVRLVLEDAGYEVVTRDTPFGTAAAVSVEKPDLLLLDVSMPALTGDKIVEVVRNNEKLKHTKVCLFSDRSELELNRIVSECGADGYIQKTDDENKLVEQVGGWLKDNLSVLPR